MYDDLLKADGFDEAIIGTAGGCSNADVLLYDTNKIISILQERDSMDEEEALEFFYFNQIGAWMGDLTPCFLSTIEQ